MGILERPGDGLAEDVLDGLLEEVLELDVDGAFEVVEGVLDDDVVLVVVEVEVADLGSCVVRPDTICAPTLAQMASQNS